MLVNPGHVEFILVIRICSDLFHRNLKAWVAYGSDKETNRHIREGWEGLRGDYGSTLPSNVRKYITNLSSFCLGDGVMEMGMVGLWLLGGTCQR